MKEQATDQSVLKHIQTLAAEEHKLFARGSLADTEAAQLRKIEVEWISVGTCCVSARPVARWGRTRIKPMCDRQELSRIMNSSERRTERWQRVMQPNEKDEKMTL